MGGKRPDQYRIDPAEGGATDYKNLPQTGRGHSNLDDTVELDRQRLARSEKEEKEDRQEAMPGRRPAPSRDANRPLREGSSEAEENRDIEREIFPEPGAADVRTRKEDPSV